MKGRREERWRGWRAAGQEAAEVSAEDGEAKMRGERERASERWAKEIAAPAARRLKPLPHSVLAPLMFYKTPEHENDHPRRL